MASSLFTSPTPFRLTQLAQDAYEMPLAMLGKKPHESHPSIDHLVLLVFEAVLEVVCVSLPGYIVARLGQFDTDKQRFLANLNVMLFTPCLSTSLSNLPSLVRGSRLTSHVRDSLHQARLAAQRR